MLPLGLMAAGLTLNWRRCRYDTPDGSFGPADSPVRLTTPAVVDAPCMSSKRAAATPSRSTRPTDAKLTLRSFIWPDKAWLRLEPPDRTLAGRDRKPDSRSCG